jgi:putative peptidoglycan lipid II flippase
MDTPESPIDRSTQEHQIARSAAIVSVGNILSRVLGLVREMAIAGIFGAGGTVSAYKAARQVPLTLYDMLIGGMVSSALVPTFSEYAAQERREELWHVASLLLTLTALSLGVLVLVLEAGVPLLSEALVQFEPPLQELTTHLLRIVIVGVFFLGLSGLTTAICHALQRFALPAFATAVFNVSVVAFAVILGPRSQDVRVLAVGLVVGAALQVAVQLPALRGLRFRPSFDLRHPVLRHILRLYLPVIASLVVSSLGVLIDRNLASRTGKESISWMSFATTLREFPLGLVSLAVSTAILPTLSALASREQKGQHAPARTPGAAEDRNFISTLAGGLRLVLVLTLPAAVGLLVLAHPLVALLFQHGEFDANDTVQTALALRVYLVGMLFAAIDLPLVFSFYALKDTLRPALVGVLGVGLYLLVALPTYRTLGMVGLILANNVQLAGHALIMVWLFRRRVGALRGHGIGSTLLKSAFASTVMGGVTYSIVLGMEQLLPVGGTLGWAATVAAGGGIGLGVYLAVCARLRVRELQLVRSLVQPLIQRVRHTAGRRQPPL